MDEITLVTAIAPIAPDLPAAVRDAARTTLLAEIAAEPAATPALATGPGSRRGAAAPRSRRLARWGIAGTALAAAAASAAIVLPGVLAGPPAASPQAGRSPSSSSRPVQPPAPATATAVLLRVARATAAVPDLVPRPDQFIYVEQTARYVTEGNRRTIIRSWQSVDGWHGGLILMRYPPGTRWYHGLREYNCRTISHSFWYWKANCPAPPAYDTRWPRTVTGMQRLLFPPASAGTGPPTAAGAIMSIANVVYQEVVPHRTSALMFQALSRIKGIRVIEHAITLAGREGIAVAAYDPSQHSLDELIFDPKTYLYIGNSQIARSGSKMPPGTVNGEAILQIAVVSKPGQLP